MPQQTKGSMRMKPATQRLKVIWKSSLIVHLNPSIVLVKERMQTLLYFVNIIVAATICRMSWQRQETKVQ